MSYKTGTMKAQIFTEDNQKFNFGKHKGETLDYVYDEDFSYIAWALENEAIKLSDFLLMDMGISR